MSSLKMFYYDTNIKDVSFKAEALTISAFKNIWDRDESENKEQAKGELAFCYFVVSMSPANPYREYSKKERIKNVIEDLYKKNPINVTDPYIIDAIEQMKKYESSAEKNFLRTAFNSLDNLREYLETVDLGERDNNDRLVHNPKQYNDILNSAASTLEALQKSKLMVDKAEIDLSNKIRGEGKEEYDI